MKKITEEFVFFDCPVCRWSAVFFADLKKLIVCRRCMGEREVVTAMHSRRAIESDEPVGPDARMIAKLRAVRR